MNRKPAIYFLGIVILSLALYGLAGAVYWRGAGPGVPLQEPMHYVDQYRYPRAWTRSQLAPGVPAPTPFAAVYGPNAVGQRFGSCCDNLAMLRLWLGSAAGQQVVFDLRTGPDEADTLYSAVFRLERDGYHDFTFPPQSDSAGQAYYFYVRAPEARAEKAVALRVIPGDRVGGVPVLNEYTATGNLDFAAYHRGRPGGWLLSAMTEQLLPWTFAVRLRQYKPAFFKGGTFGGILVVTVVAVFVWLTVAWTEGRRPGWRRGVAGLAVGVLAAGILISVMTGVVTWPRRAMTVSSGPAEIAMDGDAPALVHDLLFSLYPAEKKPERRFFSTAWAEVDGQQVPCVFAPPDSTLSYGLLLPPEAKLNLEVALESVGAWRRFELSVAGGETLFSRELRGPGALRTTVDLSGYGGQDVRLLLRTVGGEGDISPGLWCVPRIESARSWLLSYPLPTDVDLRPQGATFGDALELLGYHLEMAEAEPGGWVSLTLYWHARQRVMTNYTVFVHLIDEVGEIQGQCDSQPVNGAYPTTLWSPKKTVVDRYVVPVDDDASPGQYRLAVGLYDLATLQRLPAFGAGRRLDDDRLLLESPVKVSQP